MRVKRGARLDDEMSFSCPPHVKSARALLVASLVMSAEAFVVPARSFVAGYPLQRPTASAFRRSAVRMRANPARVLAMADSGAMGQRPDPAVRKPCLDAFHSHRSIILCEHGRTRMLSLCKNVCVMVAFTSLRGHTCCFS